MLLVSLPGYTHRARPAEAYRPDPVEGLLSYPDFVKVLLDWVTWARPPTKSSSPGCSAATSPSCPSSAPRPSHSSMRPWTAVSLDLTAARRAHLDQV